MYLNYLDIFIACLLVFGFVRGYSKGLVMELSSVIALILGVYVGFAMVINDPHGSIAVLFSHIPFTSPIVMLMRVPFGVSWYELLISMALLLVTFVFMVWLTAKIYRVGILMYGKKPTWKELNKSLHRSKASFWW